MNYILIALIAANGIVGAYCGILNNKLYQTGLTNNLSRISFKKISIASQKTKTAEQKALVKKCKSWYLTWVIAFYTFILLLVIKLFYL